ncbi:MAG TPA: ATPase, T2SS/T4P/T4SS family [Gemmatimonadaceae bacterium]|nr:ATPase, T2SS/T4P/T4SS family [Gemmatimonadaceae bacterium]
MISSGLQSDRAIADEWLIAILSSVLSRDALEQLRRESEGSVWSSTIRLGLLTDSDILRILSKGSHTQIARNLKVESEARDALPEYLARRFQVVPLRVRESTLEIAASNPYDLHAEQTIAFAIGRPVRISLASPTAIAERLEQVYRGLSPVAVGESNSQDPEAAEEPIIRLVDRIVTQGIESRASDIHLEPEEDGIAVRFRIDGLLRHVMLLPKAVGLPLVSRVKIMSKMDIADRLRPQGGHASIGVRHSRVDLRVSTLPAAHGEKVVIRILDPRSAVRSLESLGLDADDAPRMQRLLDVREGLVLVTGPTGSGKTTTLYAALLEIQRRGLNIITVEDPVEYRIPGVVQVQINEKAGLSFSAALRSILRQDPDVVLIGEIRDRETAAIAVQAALTGHLVFATLHTNDACSSITRLTDLGVDAAKLAVALKGVVAQRLIRRLCADCRIVANDGVPTQLAQSVAGDVMVYTGVGCERCGMSGYHGRVAVTEIVIADAELERAIASGAAVDALTQIARLTGARSLWDSAVAQLLNGNTSGDELLRVLEQQPVRPTEVASAQVDTTLWDLFDTPTTPAREYDSVRGNARWTHDETFSQSTSAMTTLVAGVVDVYVIHPLESGWRVLTVQRGEDTRCPGAWETIHGRIEPGERPEHAAVREVREETGLTVARLYNVTVQPFYLHFMETVQLAVVFAAFVDEPSDVKLGEEHQDHAWLSVEEAALRFAWPREREALSHIMQLLSSGTAGPVEDVLRVF